MRLIRVTYKDDTKKYFLCCESIRFLFCHQVEKDGGTITSDSKCEKVLSDFGVKGEFFEIAKIVKNEEKNSLHSSSC